MITKPVVALVALTVAAFSGAATPIKPELLSGLVWRNVGPFRGGRISAVSGVIGEPGTFYIGTPAGGVWKTTNAGATWWPISDGIKDAEVIGALEVAPSNGNIIYVGTGDLITGGGVAEGNGMYKSTDAGATWTHIGLEKTKQIPSILVDPRDANGVLVAAQGDVHTKNDSRGIYRSGDGGATWTRVLFVDDSTGIQKLATAFDKPDVVFATTVRHYTPPSGPPIVPPRGQGGGPGGGGGAGARGPTGTAIYKSVDAGATWKELSGTGLPRIPGRTSIAVAIGTDAQRVYLTTNVGFFRSDDGGATWKQMASDDSRIRNGQGGYNCGVYVDPKNPDIVYVFNTSSYISKDGGNTFTGFRGAPGGDDPQQGWIDPTNGKRIILGYDQGAIVTLDGGATWSSWYNQSTEQVYHIAPDNSFPYWIYASQQDAGAVRTRGRGNLGAVTPLDWDPVNGWEWGTVMPDPLNPNTVYATGNGVIRISYPSEEWVNVSPGEDPSLRLRANSDAPLLFTPWDPHTLLAGFQYLMSTSDGGKTWTKISPNLGYPANFTIPPDSATPKTGRSDRRHHHVDRSFDDRTRYDLGGHQHGVGEGHARQRQDVERCVRLQENRTDPFGGSVAHESRRGVRHRRCARGRRLQSVRLSHARLREDVDAHHQRPRYRRVQRQLRAHPARRPEAHRPAVPRHRERDVRVVRRRRLVAVAHAQPADDVVPRHRVQGQ
jgi:photosystem II stability/assembly factor-like uncharacterized protein